MSLGIESGTVIDRSFNAGGLSKAFKDWVVKTQPNHGPNWFVWDDQSTIGSNPYIIVSNQASPTANSKAVFIRWLVTSAAERIEMSAYLWWNNSTHVGFGFAETFYITTQTGTFSYYFRGGDYLIAAMTRIGTSISYCRYFEWKGIWDSVNGKGLEPETASGTVVSVSGNSLTLQTGQGANFTVGRWYFVIDFISTYKIRYAQVTAISGDVVTFNNLNSLAFSATSYVSPWPHRWAMIASSAGQVVVWGLGPIQHYRPVSGSEQSTSGNDCSTPYDYMVNSISTANPDPTDNTYGAQFPWLSSKSSATGGRILGEVQDVIIAAANGVAALQDRRTLNGVPYIALSNGNNLVQCLIDQESP